jgi:hypothetical protein
MRSQWFAAALPLRRRYGADVQTGRVALGIMLLRLAAGCDRVATRLP